MAAMSNGLNDSGVLGDRGVFGLAAVRVSLSSRTTGEEGMAVSRSLTAALALAVVRGRRVAALRSSLSGRRSTSREGTRAGRLGPPAAAAVVRGEEGEKPWSALGELSVMMLLHVSSAFATYALMDRRGWAD